VAHERGSEGHGEGSERNPGALGLALRIAEDAWEEVRRSPFVQRQCGAALTALPNLSEEEASRRSEVGRSVVRRLDTVDETRLPHEVALTLRAVRFRAEAWMREAELFWSVIDPLGIGMFGMFLPTAYCGGWLLSWIHGQLASFPLREAGDADRYLALVADYARLLEQFTARTAGQRARGMRMPRVQVVQARALLARFRLSARKALEITPGRAEGVGGGAFLKELNQRLENRVLPAFDRAIAGLSDAYLDQAPETVGIGQYERGADIYRWLVRLHTTLDLTPDEVQERGYARMADIARQKNAIRAELKFDGDDRAFLRGMNSDARWRATRPEEVSSSFVRYMNRIQPHLPKLFSTLPSAPCKVSALPEALQASMTYGYYEPSRKERPEGCYFFNAGNLMNQGLLAVGTLTYHELMPGHHLHLSIQQENLTLHPFRQYSFVNAFNEGWAEYAATLAGEIGMYEHPEERYGRLVMDAFFTSRLVVDTGMNALGWSLERGREYMREHSGMSEPEILSDSIRYSCDIPAQALAYKLGDSEILRLRGRMQETLGSRFDIREFHEAVLGPGGLPLRDLQWHLDHVIHVKRDAPLDGPARPCG
jgi:uncharacterized protein (DUF885 family)